MIDKQDIGRMLTAMAEDLNAARHELTELDNIIGDGDHGTNMDRGFQAVMKELPELLQHDDVGAILHHAGMTLMNTIGGSAGPLYGTLFMWAGMTCRGAVEVDALTFAGALESGAYGIAEIGGAHEGDKTMLDALFPACRALRESLNKGAALTEALAAAAQAAEQGVDYTKTIVANKGRASYISKRSLGHQDPGATSVLILLRAMQRSLPD